MATFSISRLNLPIWPVDEPEGSSDRVDFFVSREGIIIDGIQIPNQVEGNLKAVKLKSSNDSFGLQGLKSKNLTVGCIHLKVSTGHFSDNRVNNVCRR